MIWKLKPMNSMENELIKKKNIRIAEDLQLLELEVEVELCKINGILDHYKLNELIKETRLALNEKRITQ